MEEKQIIKHIRCKGCSRSRRHGLWVFISEYQMDLMRRYYSVEYIDILCDDCKIAILNGVPIK